MYLTYYNLSEKPFQLSTDPRFLWLGSNHSEALANLKYGLFERNGYVVLIGAVGTGKTTLVNALLRMLDQNVLVASINHPSLDPVEFLSLVVRTYDPSAVVSGKVDCLQHLRAFLLHARAQAKTVLLVIDEAHRLSETLLEEIRLLSNMEQDGEKLINIFFVGQTELKRKLQSSRCSALRQRITLFHHLQPLSKADTTHYIAHRLKMAGTEAQLFTSKSIHAIYRFSRGYPRLINKICDRAMLTGYVKEQAQIDLSIVRECAREISLIDPIISSMPLLERLSLFWKYLATTLKRWSSTVTAAVLNAGATAQMKTPAIGRSAGHFIQKHRGKIRVVLPAAAGLIVVGWMFAGHWEQGRPTEMRGAAKQAQTSDEPVILGENPPDHPHQKAGAEEKSSLSSGLPQPMATAPPAQTAASPSPLPSPSMTEIAAAMMAQNDFQAVIALFEGHSDPSPADPAEAATLYARALVGRAGQLTDRSPKDSETLLIKAAAVDPRNIDALVQLGNQYTRSKKFPEAIDTYRKALQLNPQLTDVLFNLGFILANSGLYESAEEMLTRAVQLKPDYVDKALFNLAVVQQKIGKRKESLASLEAAVAIRPENAKAQDYLKELKSTKKEDR